MLKWWKDWRHVVVLTVLLSLWGGVAAQADTRALQLRELNSLFTDGATPDTPTYFMLVGGLDSSGVVQALRTDSTGQLVDGVSTSVTTYQLNCGSSATQLTAAAGRSVTITALAANTAAVYIGASDVTTSTGHELVQSTSYSDNVDNANRFYCVSAAGTMDISVIVTN